MALASVVSRTFGVLVCVIEGVFSIDVSFFILYLN
jgi:hypothetical protein